jgi:hypothetical protein
VPTLTVTPTMTGLVNDAYPSTSYGVTNWIGVGADTADASSFSDPTNGSGGELASYLEFNIPSIPSGAYVNSITLVFTVLWSDNGGVDYGAPMMPVDLISSTGGWDPTTLTWNNQPSGASYTPVLLAQTTTQAQGLSSFSFDITIFASPGSTFNCAICIDGDWSSSSVIEDNGRNPGYQILIQNYGSNQPTIIVDYTAPSSMRRVTFF